MSWRAPPQPGSGAGWRAALPGAHCEAFDDAALGIENEGTHMTVALPGGQSDVLVGLCAWLCGQYGIPATELYGHRDFNNTSCPGDVLSATLSQLRADVAARLGISVRLWPTTRGPISGEWVRSAHQRLLLAAGQSLSAGRNYGDATALALSAFQSPAGLTPDGITGSATWECQIHTVRWGTQRQRCAGRSDQLAAHGCAVMADGALDPGTEKAVKTFQSSQDLSNDGIVWSSTWHALRPKQSWVAGGTWLQNMTG